MESQIWSHLPALWLCVGRAQKRNNGLCLPFCLGESCLPGLAFMPDTSVPPCMPLLLFKLLLWPWSSEGVSWISSCVDSLRGTAWDSWSLFHWVSLHWFLQAESIGTCLPRIGTLGWRIWCGPEIPHSWDIPPEFLSTTHGCDISLFCISTPPSSLDGCGFFNSVVVRLPFNLFSDSSEWWLFYIVVVILMRLCEEASNVYLFFHLLGTLWQDTENFKVLFSWWE